MLWHHILLQAQGRSILSGAAVSADGGPRCRPRGGTKIGSWVGVRWAEITAALASWNEGYWISLAAAIVAFIGGA
jgi:hypothetical protein